MGDSHHSSRNVQQLPLQRRVRLSRRVHQGLRESSDHRRRCAVTPEQKIYLSEVEAIARGAPHVDVPSTLFATDNQAAHYAMRKGHSSSYAANVMFRRAFGPVKPWSIWVPTYLQPSDRYTRGIKLPTLPSPIDAPVIDAIRFTQLNAYGYPNSKRSIDQRALCVAPNVRV